jgi:glycerol-3-phosphate O-acyltransferase
MLGIKNLYYSLVKLPLRALVRIKTVPDNPTQSLQIDKDKPIYYVLRTRSVSSFLMLQQQCEKLGLPRPQNLSSTTENIPNGGVFFIQHKQIFGRRPSTIKKYTQLLQKLVEQHQANLEQAQLIPVSIYWGRNPGKEKSLLRLLLTDTESANPLRKLMILLFQGRNSFMQFGKPVQINLIKKASSSEALVRKITRTLRVYFHNQWRAAMGPLVANRKQVIASLLARDDVLDAIEHEQKKKKIPFKKARQIAYKYADEIAANYTYSTVRILSSVLSWLWNKMYAGISVTHADRVRELARSHEIVYVPCHRSHMDYLLLSYVLYYEGLVPPHIAAGINLNFWPIGGVLRRGGAFYIRRSFSGNKLYTAVFNAYFHSLLDKGVPVEFFPEGGRSRTGRLLHPKTGMLAMMVQNYMRGCHKPIAIIPVYIGYERMMEGRSYIKEMQGAQKQKESMGQLLKVRNQLKQRYGKVYVNFAQPILLNQRLDQQQPEWRNQPSMEKPQWLPDFVLSLGEETMTRINRSAAVNCVNLTSLILLSTQRHTMGKSELLKQIELYLNLIKNAPWNDEVTLPEEPANELLEEAKKLGAVNEFSNPLGNLCHIPDHSAVLQTYYRNNIIHLLALPALIASCFRQKSSLKKAEVLACCKAVYPLLKRELFLHFETDDLANPIEHYLTQLAHHKMLTLAGDDVLRPSLDSDEFSQLMLLADTLKETLERYGITLSLLAAHAGQKAISRAQLESQSQQLAQRIAALYNIYAPESFDKAVFQQIVGSLRRMGFISGDGSELTINASVPDLQLLVMSMLNHATQQSLVKTTRWAVNQWRN